MSKTRTGYAEIAADYRARIERGEWSPGELMPTVGMTAAAYRVTNTTAHRAHALLRDEGFIITRSRAGTRVADRSKPRVCTCGAVPQP